MSKIREITPEEEKIVCKILEAAKVVSLSPNKLYYNDADGYSGGEACFCGKHAPYSYSGSPFVVELESKNEYIFPGEEGEPITVLDCEDCTKPDDYWNEVQILKRHGYTKESKEAEAKYYAVKRKSENALEKEGQEKKKRRLSGVREVSLKNDEGDILKLDDGDVKKLQGLAIVDVRRMTKKDKQLIEDKTGDINAGCNNLNDTIFEYSDGTIMYRNFQSMMLIFADK